MSGIHLNEPKKRKVYYNEIDLKKLRTWNEKGKRHQKVRQPCFDSLFQEVSCVFSWTHFLEHIFSFLFSLFIYDRKWFYHFCGDTFSMLTAHSWLTGIPYFPFWFMKEKIWTGQVLTPGPPSYSQRTVRDTIKWTHSCRDSSYERRGPMPRGRYL